MTTEGKPILLRQSYKYYAECNKGTRRRIIRTMVAFAKIWNNGLKDRQGTYAESLKNPEVKPVNSYYSQYHLIRKREHPEYSRFTAQAMQDVLAKLDGSYKSFFDLIKKDPSARPPKEKGIHRCLTYSQSGWKLEGNDLVLKNIGRLKLKLHRSIEGNIKTVSITLNKGKFYVCFSCELPPVPVVAKEHPKTVRLSFEDNLFIKDSEGEIVKHPEFYFTEIERLRKMSRSLSRKEKGSKNRKKAKYTLQKWHTHIANKRKYFIEEIANDYVSQFDVIEVPKLPLKQKIMQATTSRKAMSLCDAAYGLFVSFLKHCAKKNGKTIVEYAL